MKTRVGVTIIQRAYVTIEVEHEEDDDPTDLTREDEDRAIDFAPDAMNEIIIEKVEIHKP